MNRLAATEGARRVAIECTDQAGAVVFTGTERWPFSDPELEGGRPTRR